MSRLRLLLMSLSWTLLVAWCAATVHAQDRAPEGRASAEGGGPKGVDDLASLAERAKRSVVHLELLDSRGRSAGSGSGFFVSADGRIITNHHVIDEVSSVVAVLHDGQRVPILGLLRGDREHDVAVILAAGGGYEPLSLGSSHAMKAGDAVAVIGSPAGFAGTLSTGIVSAVRSEGPKLDLSEVARYRPEAWTIQITAPISPGSSGSPVIETKRSTVVAVAVGQTTEGQALNFAVPIEHAQALLDSLAPNHEPKPFARSARSPRIWSNLLISAAFYGGLALIWWGVGWRRRPKRA